jgi:hypothetical protein
VTGAGPWAATCPLENRVKNNAINDKIPFSFIRVIPLDLVISLCQRLEFQAPALQPNHALIKINGPHLAL